MKEKVYNVPKHNLTFNWKTLGRLGCFTLFCCCFSQMFFFAESWACRLTWSQCSLYLSKFLSKNFNQSEQYEGKIVLTFFIQNTLSFLMDKKFINMKSVEIWKRNNINELQTCPFRRTEVIFIKILCQGKGSFLFEIMCFKKQLRKTVSQTFALSLVVLCKIKVQFIWITKFRISNAFAYFLAHLSLHMQC